MNLYELNCTFLGDMLKSNYRVIIEASHRNGPYGSPDAQTARHSFRSAYWNYKYYRANYLPSLSLTSDPNLNRAINKITMGDGSVKFVEQNLLNTDLTLNLSQNLSWTGGSFFLETSAQRMDLFSEHKYSWQTSPIMIGYRQSLFGYK